MRAPASELPPRIMPVGQEAEDTVQAIVLGEVDSLLVEGPDGPRVYTLAGAEEPYRLLVERRCEAAVVLSENGIILYGNGRLKEWLAIGDGELCGHRFDQLVARDHPAAAASAAAAAAVHRRPPDRRPGPGQSLRADGKTLDATESMLSRLMDFAALESGNDLVRREVFRLDSLVREIIGESADEAAAKGLTLARRLPPCWTDSDLVLLRRILGNLIANACRYTDRGGLVVAIRRRGGRHRIEVWDTGIGIAPDQQRVIFEEFHQLDNPERNRTKGHGLGLAIVAKTAELLGHRLFLRSVAGRGSVFALEVPQAEAPEQKPEPATAGVAPSGGSATILVVEDDPVQADALDAIFTSLGYRVILARDPAQAMARHPLAPDLIISDYRLPGGRTGVEVVAHIRQTTGRPVPAIIMTGDTQATVAREAGQAGCAILHKPCTFAVLIAAIDRALPA